MSFYRSDSISHYKMVLPRESAWEIMNKLGQYSLVDIIPNSTVVMNRPFGHQVKRCEEALQKIFNIEKVLYDRKLYKPKSQISLKKFRELLEVWQNENGKSQRTSSSMIEDIDAEVQSTWNYYFDLNKRIDELKNKVRFYRRNIAVIRAGEKVFGRSFFTNNQSRVNELGNLYLHQSSQINFKCGVINNSEEIRFQKTVFRITKGNCLTSCIPFRQLFEVLMEEQKSKVVFFILFPGRQQNYFESKLTRLVQSYSQEQYDISSKISEFQTKIKSYEDGYIQTQNLLNLTQNEMNQFLNKFVQYSQQYPQVTKCQYLKLYLLKQKQIYHQMNEMGLYNNFIQGEIYVRKDDVLLLQQLFNKIQKNFKLPAGQLVTTQAQKLPTNFVLNDYTISAYEVVSTYGVARYQQANPALFTTITFPFLFGVMFGDIGHGAILLSFGLYLCFKHHQIQNFMLKMLVPHRYLFTLMGFFAMYCGFIYNQFLSLALNLFGSCYNPQAAQANQPIPGTPNCVYPIGLDPVWSVAQNNLNYVNSLKMKISVIIGVLHMTVGVFIKATNTLYFKKYMQFFFEFIPQLVFLILLFGYMDFLIIYKWTVNWDQNTAVAPSIITTMINLPLKLGKTDNCCGGQPMWGTYGNTSQDTIQLIFFLVSIICIPLMLLPKPLYQIYCHKTDAKRLRDLRQQGRNLLKSSESLEQGQQLIAHQQHDPGEIFVHQMIETIEYVLGCISNTASYLRLWALSLAHSQLEQVFFQKTVEGPLVNGFSGIPIMILGFFILSLATFGVLLCMDTLECFLHTLRLHWVQFQNKFYKGDGFAFNRYDFYKRVNQQLKSHALD